MSKKTIFDKLDDLNIVYSVCTNYLTLSNQEHNTKDQYATNYFIVCSLKDFKKVKSLKFKISKSYYNNLLEYDLKNRQIYTFKELLEIGKFKQIHSDKNGKVFELTGNSFKKYFNTK